MAKQRYVKDSFWSDPYIQELSQIDKLFFLYLLTNQNCNIAGIYEITERQICFDTGIDKNRLVQAVDRLSKDKKIIYKDNWMIIINFIKNQSMNPSVEKGIQRVIESLPERIKDRLGTGWVQAGTYSTLLNSTLLNSTEEEKIPIKEINDFQEFKERWNNVKPFGLAKKGLPKVVKDADKLIEAYKKKRKEYEFNEIISGLSNYCNYMNTRPKDEKGFYEHRFSMIEFLTREKGLDKYINFSS